MVLLCFRVGVRCYVVALTCIAAEKSASDKLAEQVATAMLAVYDNIR